MGGVQRRGLARITAAKALWSVVRASRRPGAPGLGTRLASVPRMVRWGMSGRYPHLDGRRWGLVVLGLVYLVSPVDVVPELLLPLVGLGDDLVVLTWLAGAVLAETETFLDWEERERRRRDRDVHGEIVE